MTKTQENNLCRDIGRIARSLERIARAVEKPDGGEKTEVIRCKDCKRYIRHDKRCGYWNHGENLQCGAVRQKGEDLEHDG